MTAHAIPGRMVLLVGIVLSLLPRVCRAGSMAAWWTDIGPSFVLQNATTGLLTYSACNSNNTPIYPVDPPNEFVTKYEPKNGTSLTGTGWFDQTTTWASLFYQNNNDDIVNAIYTCNFTSGRYMLKDSKVISDRSGTPGVHPNTGLSVALLGEKEGYVVFFHDRNKAMQSLKYNEVELWSYGGPISTNTNRTGLTISSMFSGVRNVSVVTPRDGSNIEVSRLNIDGAWHTSTFPAPLGGVNITNYSNATSFPFDTSTPPSFTLDEWSGNPKALGIAIDTALTRHIFYLGKDRNLHSIAAFVTGTTEGGWRTQPDQPNNIWPQADESDGDFAIASDLGTSKIRLYYTSGGRLVETKYNDKNWEEAGVLAVANATAPASTSSGSGDEGTGLSSGAKAGVGVGVAIGALLLAAAGFWFLRKRKIAADEERNLAAASSTAENKAAEEVTRGSRDGSTGDAAAARPISIATDPGKWDPEVKNSPMRELESPTIPRELESPNLASELPEFLDRHEMQAQSRSGGKNIPELA